VGRYPVPSGSHPSSKEKPWEPAGFGGQPTRRAPPDRSRDCASSCRGRIPHPPRPAVGPTRFERCTGLSAPGYRRINRVTRRSPEDTDHSEAGSVPSQVSGIVLRQVAGLKADARWPPATLDTSEAPQRPAGCEGMGETRASPDVQRSPARRRRLVRSDPGYPDGHVAPQRAAAATSWSRPARTAAVAGRDSTHDRPGRHHAVPALPTLVQDSTSSTPQHRSTR
jgi:hypothetical protein